MTSSSQEGSRNFANPTPQPENDWAKKMTATSGRRCLESLEKFSQVGLWAKMFSALLIGQKGWSSTRCKLTWKLRGTKYSRLYFQLVPSTLRTEEIESGLLPTPNASDSNNANNKNNHDVERGYLRGYATMGMLPTPTASTGGGSNMSTKNPRGKHSGNPLKTVANMGMLPTPRVKGHGNSHQRIEDGKIDDLTTMARFGMLPTPRASEWKGTGPIGSKSHTHMLDKDYLCAVVQQEYPTGKTSQLNPHFVLEMMGFPPDWTLSPFLNGEMNP